MPRRICPSCKGQYGRYTLKEVESASYCPECATINRQNIERKEAENAEHARQMEITRLEVEAGERRLEQEEETKRMKIREEEETKRRQQEIERFKIEVLKLKIEAERELKAEETEQLKIKHNIENAKEAAEVQKAQEKTKQVKAEAEERTKQIEAEERTKLTKTEAEKLALCDHVLTTLAKAGADRKVMMQTFLCKELVGEFPLEKTFPSHTPNASQREFLESMGKQPKTASKQNNDQRRCNTLPAKSTEKTS